MKTIIELAKAAGFFLDYDNSLYCGDRDGVCTEELERFAALVRAERECDSTVTSEARKEWVDLTDDEIAAIPFPHGFARAVIAAFKEKNK